MPDIASIQPSELKKIINDGRELALVDVREQGIFGQNHLLYAVSVPLSQLELRIGFLLPRLDVRMVIMDGGSGSTLASMAARKLAALGYSDIRMLSGGTAGWHDAGYELFSGVNVPSKAFGEFVEQTYETPRLTAESLKTWIDAGEDILILDSRPFDEYHRMSIPGGIDTPGAELVYRVHDLAPNRDTTIIVNCAGRTRSIIGAQSLINAGIDNKVMALENGTMGWHLAGLEVAKGAIDVAHAPSTGGLAKAKACAERVANRFAVETIDLVTMRAWQADKTRTTYILDVRTADEFDAGHLPGSRHAPGGQLVQGTDEFVGVRNARLLLVDDTGVRATMTASWLIQMGWSEVRVLAEGIGEAGTETGPNRMESLLPPSVDRLDAAGLAAELSSANPPLIVDLDTSLAFRAGHVPGAWWSVRSRFTHDIKNLPEGNDIIITSGDGAIAPYAVADLLEHRPDAQLRVLDGGTAAWRSAGLPLETGSDTLLGRPDDVQYKPYDNPGGVEAAMRAYLSWETALVEQLHRDGDTRFRTFPVR